MAITGNVLEKVLTKRHLEAMSPEIAWRDNLSDARLLAEKQNKPIFVDWADFPSCVGCVSLENTTYPNEEVISYLNEQFIPVQLNQSQNIDFFKENQVFWTPTVTVCGAQGTERYRWNGYLPAEEFLPKTKFAFAWIAMLNQDFAKAAITLKEIASSHKHSLTAPEALYWLGVANWKVSKDFVDLSNAWTTLVENYPNTEAALKASCL
jgi:thioredoxin-related protein